ncbi:hypothetical protein DGG96_11910 [Legionella qingyii]|uniref:Uncharacterized protein n=1 Tax=Legionella qingyii TaxID=2184757 RepID=A0A317U3S0_9GAMM|nr:hypothetical protein [Legionella qingyii]PWY55477.1 hypothetical protein DGG96_11910 [Legionella qingyii]
MLDSLVTFIVIHHVLQSNTFRVNEEEISVTGIPQAILGYGSFVDYPNYSMQNIKTPSISATRTEIK